MSAEATYRAEVVGSLLRPTYLREAQDARQAGELSDEAFTAAEDRAVDEAIALQEQAGVDVVTDGEMRRRLFFGHFISDMDGLAPLPSRQTNFRNDAGDQWTVTIPFTVTERLRFKQTSAVAEYTYARTRTRRPVKVTLPSPMMALEFWADPSRDAYGDPFDLARDAAEIVRRWAHDLAEAGCTYIQFDAPELLQAYADDRVRAEYEHRGIPADEFIAVGTELIDYVADVPGARTAVHLCKGNGPQMYIAAGSYESLSQRLFRQARNVDAFLLEYDDGRSGGFEPLRGLPDDKVAVLGLVSSKIPDLEAADVLRARVREAAAFHPLEQLGVCTQCGFASVAESAAERGLDGPAQAAKLKLVADVAGDIWG